MPAGTGFKCPSLSYLASAPKLAFISLRASANKKIKDTRHRKLTEESIVQRQLLDTSHIRIIHEIRIDIEEDRHVDRLPRIQPLLLEAETLNLAKVRRYLTRCHAVRRHPDDVLVAFIRCGIECQCCLAGEHPHLALLWYELPRQHV